MIGSRVVESFLSSNCPNDKKQKFVDKFTSNYVNLSYDRFGAHCVEAIFQAAELNRKVQFRIFLRIHGKIESYGYGAFTTYRCVAERQ